MSLVPPLMQPGSQHRVWSFDPVNNYAYFKMYDECGGKSSDCTENESVVYIDWYKVGGNGYRRMSACVLGPDA